MEQQTIDALVDLASTAFFRQSSPSDYAKTAAQRAAFAAASQHSPELADFASLLAAGSFLSDATESLCFSARLSDAAGLQLAANRGYLEEWQAYNGIALPQEAQCPQFFLRQALDCQHQSGRFEEGTLPIYERTQVPDVALRNKSRRAAAYVYRDVYAACRAAYVRASFTANRFEGQHRLDLFKTRLRARLQQDLRYDIILPGFLLQAMASRALLVLSLLVILAAVAAVVIAALGLLALPTVTTIAVGSAAAAVGLAVFVGGFFARSHCQQMLEANEHRADSNAVF